MDTVLVLGAFAGMLAGFFALFKFALSQAAQDRESDRGERNALIKATEDMATASKLVATEMKKGNKEAERRNGHLAELVLESKQATIDSIQNIDKQHVHVQEIDKAVVKDKTIK